MSTMHAEFIVIIRINLGIGQITFQYMPDYMQKLAFLLGGIWLLRCNDSRPAKGRQQP
jgi:hypothetical protein